MDEGDFMVFDESHYIISKILAEIKLKKIPLL